MSSFVRTVRTLSRVRVAAPAAAGCALLAGVFCLGSQGVQAASSPNLQQSVEAIRQILAKDGQYLRTTTTARKDYKSLTERKFSVSEADGCKLIVKSDAHVHTELTEQKRVSDREWSDIYRPDFSLMDPSTVTVTDPEPPQEQWQTKGYMVRISVEVDKPLMIASSVDPKSNTARDMPGLPTLAVYVTSRETADRLGKAFAQLATACRANPAAK